MLIYYYIAIENANYDILRLLTAIDEYDPMHVQLYFAQSAK